MDDASLVGKFLIAMPSLADPNFWRTVVLIGSHARDEGAFGLVVNRPAEVALREVVAQLGLESGPVRESAVLSGGPVEPSQGFVIVDGALPEPDPNSLDTGAFTISGRSDLLALLVEGGLDRDFALCLGYAGWHSGQLERELEENAWLLAPASSEVVFSVPLEDRWRAALASIGVDPGTLVDSGATGQPS